MRSAFAQLYLKTAIRSRLTRYSIRTKIAKGSRASTTRCYYRVILNWFICIVRTMMLKTLKLLNNKKGSNRRTSSRRQLPLLKARNWEKKGRKESLIRMNFVPFFIRKLICRSKSSKSSKRN